MRRHLAHSHRRRAVWTVPERLLIGLALLLIGASLSLEAYHWMFPPLAPAAPRAQEEATATATLTPSATNAPSATVEVPTEPPTATVEVPTEPPTATVEVPTEPPTATVEPPTATTPATITPSPTVQLVSAPLILEQASSAASARPGEPLDLTLVVTTSSLESRRVIVRYQIDQRLEVVAITTASGLCSPATEVTCTLELNNATPGLITVSVRVAEQAVPGITLLSQAVAQDDTSVTAVSNRVVVTVAGSVSLETLATQVVAPTATTPPAAVAPPAAPDQPQPAAPTATPEVVAAAEIPAPAAPPAVPPAPPEQASNADLLRGTPVLPPTLVPQPAAPTPLPPTQTSPVLPETAATLPIFGLGVGLLGLAMTLHGTRRVRRADAQLTNESAALGQLSPLIDQSVALQHSTISEIERMHQHTQDMQQMLDSLGEQA